VYSKAENSPTVQVENENNLTVVAGYLHSSKATITSSQHEFSSAKKTGSSEPQISPTFPSFQ